MFYRQIITVWSTKLTKNINVLRGQNKGCSQGTYSYCSTLHVYNARIEHSAVICKTRTKDRTVHRKISSNNNFIVGRAVIDVSSYSHHQYFSLIRSNWSRMIAVIQTVTCSTRTLQHQPASAKRGSSTLTRHAFYPSLFLLSTLHSVMYFLNHRLLPNFHQPSNKNRTCNHLSKGLQNQSI